MALAVTVGRKHPGQERHSQGERVLPVPLPFGILFRTLSAVASLMGEAIVRIGSRDVWPLRLHFNLNHSYFKFRISL